MSAESKRGCFWGVGWWRVRVTMGGKRGDGGQRSKLAGLINLVCCRSKSILPLIRTVFFKRGTLWRGSLYVICTAWCQWGFSCIYLWIRFYLDLFVCCCNLNLFYDCSECVMSVLGTTKHSQCSCIDTWQYSCVETRMPPRILLF